MQYCIYNLYSIIYIYTSELYVCQISKDTVYTGLDMWLYLENSGVSDWKAIRCGILMYGIGTSKVLGRGLDSLGNVALLNYVYNKEYIMY